MEFLYEYGLFVANTDRVRFHLANETTGNSNEDTSATLVSGQDYFAAGVFDDSDDENVDTNAPRAIGIDHVAQDAP